MAHREIRHRMSDISDPQTITQKNVEAFKREGLDIHRHEVDELIDDHSAGVRVLKVRGPRIFIDLGRGRGR